MDTIALFPLSGVLLPYGRMPLQIFEQRYLDLVRSSMKSEQPFGNVWIRRGSEVPQQGRASAELGDWGTLARIVDWDQLPNGLLGITIQGEGRFDLYETQVQSNGLVLGQVEYRDPPVAAGMLPQWQSMSDVLQSLETHPHVQGMQLQVDYTDAWQVAWTLIQLLPLDEYIKYELLGLNTIEEVMAELDLILNQISGEA
jgi:Lon protease-like protein